MPICSDTILIQTSALLSNIRLLHSNADTLRYNQDIYSHIKNVELDKSGSNIANHAWANDHKIDFDGGKIIDKGTYRHRQTLESWHTACTKGSDNSSKHLPEQYRFLINKH